jgi:hypothetical protein
MFSHDMLAVSFKGINADINMGGNLLVCLQLDFITFASANLDILIFIYEKTTYLFMHTAGQLLPGAEIFQQASEGAEQIDNGKKR